MCRRVAVPHDLQDAVEDLLGEIRILSHISHPRLVPLVGACLEESQVAMVTELATGGNLHHALHVRKVDFTRVQHYQIAIEFLEGVRYLHALQPPVLHLDLKSMNLVLDAEFQHVKICTLVVVGDVEAKFCQALRRHFWKHDTLQSTVCI